VEKIGKLFNCLVETFKKYCGKMPKYKEIMYVSSMQIDDVSVFFAHDLPHFPYY
jgi:hypothetical protein